MEGGSGGVSPSRDSKAGALGEEGEGRDKDRDPPSRRNSGTKEHGLGVTGVLQKQRGGDEEEEVKARHGRIEELDLLPGQEKGVIVQYKPGVVHRQWQGGEGTGRATGATYDKALATLTKRDFQIVLKAMYNEEAGLLGRLDSVHAPAPQALTLHSRRVMIGKARVCTSFIEVPQEVNLGDCTIGSSKKGELTLKNLSEMPTSASISFQSKILRVVNGQNKPLSTDSKIPQVQIAPNSTVNLYLEIVPMRINPAYCKQITVVNHSNPANHGYVTLKSNNEDSNRVSLHALFYLVRTRHPSNTIYFDTIVTNSPIFRTFTLKNITQSDVVLELTPSNPEAISLYLETDPFAAPPPAAATAASTQNNRQPKASTDKPRVARALTDKLGPQIGRAHV